MLKHRFLLIPFLIFFLAWIIDKGLLLEKVQTYFTKTMSEVNYFHKPELFEELKVYLKQKDRKKVLVYFGNSRALLFSNPYIEKKFPDWILFNFSVPGGTPDYSLYWLEQFDSQGVKPDFILLDNSAEAFNLSAFIKIDEVLVNGLDFSFLMRYRNRYTSKEITNFMAKRLFRTYQYRPKLDTVIQRMANNFLILETYRKWRLDTREKLRKERGSATSDLAPGFTSKAEVVEKYAQGDFQSYLSPYRFNENMLFFQEESFKLLNKNKLRGAAIWVRIAPPYFKLMQSKNTEPENKTVYDIYYPKIREIHDKHNIPLLNMNEDKNYNCNEFSDASHMAPACFPDYTDYIFNHIQQK